MIVRPLFLALLALAASCAHPEDDPPRAQLDAPAQEHEVASDDALAVPAGAPLVVFLGDSISAGLHLDPSQAFPAVLQRSLARDGRPFRLVNAGVSGDTSAGGLRRVDWLLQQKPDVLVVELGGNDGLRGQDLAAVETNLRGIVERAKAAGARVLLLSIELPPSLGADYASGFGSIYARIAKDTGATLVPGFLRGVGDVPSMLLADGLHPSAKGHEKLAATIAPALTSLYDEIAAELVEDSGGR